MNREKVTREEFVKMEKKRGSGMYAACGKNLYRKEKRVSDRKGNNLY